MNLFYWGGPVYCKTANEIAWVVPTTVVCNPKEGSSNRAYFDSVRSDPIADVLKKSKQQSYDRRGFGGFSAFHGYMDPVLQEHHEKIDYVHLADACFQGAGATAGKKGFVLFARRAAQGQARLTMTTNGPWDKDISYMGPAGSKYEGQRFNLTSGAKCIHNVWREAFGQEPVPVSLETPASVPRPDKIFKNGECYWFHYEGKGVKDPHGWHVNTLAAPYIQMFGAPWMGRVESPFSRPGSATPGLIVGGMILFAVSSIFYLTLKQNYVYSPNSKWAHNFPKKCGRCGTIYNEKSWKGLKLVGVQKWEWGMSMEYRNCPCGTTLAITDEPM
jgi:hypothetical protein